MELWLLNRIDSRQFRTSIRLSTGPNCCRAHLHVATDKRKEGGVEETFASVLQEELATMLTLRVVLKWKHPRPRAFESQHKEWGLGWHGGLVDCGPLADDDI